MRKLGTAILFVFVLWATSVAAACRTERILIDGKWTVCVVCETPGTTTVRCY